MLPYSGRRRGDVLTDEEVIRQLKRWAIAGPAIPENAVDGRMRHMDIDVRTVGAQTDPEDLG